nr:unnamed protein product [Digitaria exilis]
MAELDPSNKGYIELEDMKSLLHQALGNSPFRHLLKRHLSLELSTLESSSSSSYPLRRWCRRAHYFLEDNWRHVCLMLTWLSVCAGFFAWKFLQYRHHHHDVFEVMGYCVCVAKGSAETLKLNMALVLLLPVCRSNTITTWFRTRVVPVNDTVNLHEVIAVGAVAGAGVHTISHLACGFPRLKGTEGWTGMVMLVLMVVASTLATPWLRRARLGPMEWLTGHEAFWWNC